MLPNRHTPSDQPMWAMRTRAGVVAPMTDLLSSDAEITELVADQAGSLLLAEGSAAVRTALYRLLLARGFTVTSVATIKQARLAAAGRAFSHAVVNLQLSDGDGLTLVRTLRGSDPTMQIVVITDADSFATVVLALAAGADDYIAIADSSNALVDALLGATSPSPAIPQTPLGLRRTCWEHLVRLYEQCGRNTSETARRLGMHRRSLQRILSKRAPCPRVQQR
jgi:two-component system, response regulator RegA